MRGLESAGSKRVNQFFQGDFLVKIKSFDGYSAGFDAFFEDAFIGIFYGFFGHVNQNLSFIYFLLGYVYKSGYRCFVCSIRSDLYGSFDFSAMFWEKNTFNKRRDY